MIVINFSHPLTDTQKKAVEQLKARPISQLIEQMVYLDQATSFAGQIQAFVEAVGLHSAEWQSERILIVPPGHAPATAVLLAELHGRMGYFPEMVRIRPNPNGDEPFEVSEIIRLQTIRHGSNDAQSPLQVSFLRRQESILLSRVDTSLRWYDSF